MKTKKDIQRPEIPDLRQAQKCVVVKVLWRDHNPPPLKSSHCGKKITQLDASKTISKRSESLVTIKIKKLNMNYIKCTN